MNSLNPRLLILESPVILLIIKMLYVSHRREKSFGALDMMPEELENRAEMMRQTCDNLVCKNQEVGIRFYSS